MNKDKEIDFMDEVINKEGMSRRDALKFMGISPIAAAAIAGTTSGSMTPLEASDAKGKIVIVGAGAGGIMAMAKLRRALKNPDITIIAPNEKHLYQPGQVFMAAGEYKFEDIVRDNKNYIPDDVKWIKDEVKTFDPEGNKVILRSGDEVSYDYLVVATGLACHYDWIEGLSEDLIGKYGISSVYLNNLEKGTADGGSITWDWFNEVREAAKNSKPRVLFTQPATPIKCGGAPQKMLYLNADYLKEAGLDSEMIYATSALKLFGAVPAVDKVLMEEVQPRYGNITNKFAHNLVAVDAVNKKATFEHAYTVKGEYDEDIEEYTTITKVDRVEIEYDFLHVVPPMTGVDSIVNSPLAWQSGSAKGWLEVDKETLQHTRYKNVFGIGDICGIPIGKTGGSARHHAPVVTANLIAEMEGKKPKELFNGYTVCPLKTQYGKIILAEFNYKGAAPSFPLAVEQPRWIWWAFDLYLLKPMYWHLMMRGFM